MSPRQALTIDDIKDRLLLQLDSVVARYAPPAPGSYTKGGLYATLNPGRADRSVGSFFIHMTGPKAGRWADYAMSGREAAGDVLDLIRLSCGFSTAADAIREARAFLGLEHESPELARSRAAASEALRQRRQAEAERAAAQRQKQAEWARGLYLSAREDILGTPVEHYLAGRGIDLRALARVPAALRYHPECTYVEERDRIDPDTGEVLGTDRIRHKLPAMVAAIVDGRGGIIAAHRTYLAIGPEGRWTKAPLPDAKKVLGDYRGGSVRLSTGHGPRGGKAVRLAACPPGTRVVIGEGIETCLSVMRLRPDLRVLAGVSLSNLAAIDLPANVAEVVLLSDGDTHPQAVAAFDAAVAAHAARGRVVRVWRSPVAGEDFNDALKRALTEGAAA